MLRIVIVTALLSSSSIFAADWSDCSTWLKKYGNLKGHFHQFSLGDDGKISPTPDTKHFKLIGEGIYKMDDISKIHPAGKHVEVTIEKKDNFMKVVRKFSTRETDGMSIKKADLNYQITTFQVLPSGKCVPYSQYSFSHDIKSPKTTLVAKQDFFAPICHELYSSTGAAAPHTIDLAKIRKDEILQSLSSKSVLETVKKSIPELANVTIRKFAGDGSTVEEVVKGCEDKGFNSTLLHSYTKIWNGIRSSTLPNDGSLTPISNSNSSSGEQAGSGTVFAQ